METISLKYKCVQCIAYSLVLKALIEYDLEEREGYGPANWYFDKAILIIIFG